jgi:hypothetical protein
MSLIVTPSPFLKLIPYHPDSNYFRRPLINSASLTGKEIKTKLEQFFIQKEIEGAE